MFRISRSSVGSQQAILARIPTILQHQVFLIMVDDIAFLQPQELAHQILEIFRSLLIQVVDFSVLQMVSFLRAVMCWIHALQIYLVSKSKGQQTMLGRAGTILTVLLDYYQTVSVLTLSFLFSVSIVSLCLLNQRRHTLP